MSEFNKIEENHNLFINEYLKDFNGKRAYMTVYKDCTPESAEVSSSRLLSDDKIKEKISNKAKELIEKSDTEILKLIQRQKEIAFSDIRDIMGWDEKGKSYYKSSDEIDKNIIQSVKTNKDGSIEFKCYDAQKALDALARYYSLYNDKIQIEHSGEISTKFSIIGIDATDTDTEQDT